MTTILAIETSCERASLALMRHGEVQQRNLPGSGAAHSGSVLPAIKAMLAEAGLPFSALDLIAFGRGPGAFTGMRLACGVAQGIALGIDRPVAAISSLEALALPFAAQADAIYCAMDARMNEAYVARYRVNAGQLVLEGVLDCVPPEALPLPQETGWLGVGTAFAAYAARLPAGFADHVTLLDDVAVPLAADVARIAAARPELWLDAALAAPDYVRNRVALTTAERLAQGGRA